jgi:CMP-N-acetylneuraminic acid synthetase
MKKIAVIIPAQENNRYHKDGDLAPFGDTTLLEWKISQCLDAAPATDIHVATPSQKIGKVARRLGVQVLDRANDDYVSLLVQVGKEINDDTILWANPTSPFVGGSLYRKMIDAFFSNDCDCLVSVIKLKEYAFYKGKKLNFGSAFISRSELEPLVVLTNGCNIMKRRFLREHNSLVSDSPLLFSVDSLAATEIKDMKDLTVTNTLLSLYFESEIKV